MTTTDWYLLNVAITLSTFLLMCHILRCEGTPIAHLRGEWWSILGMSAAWPVGLVVLFFVVFWEDLVRERTWGKKPADKEVKNG